MNCLPKQNIKKLQSLQLNLHKESFELLIQLQNFRFVDRMLLSEIFLFFFFPPASFSEFYFPVVYL